MRVIDRKQKAGVEKDMEEGTALKGPGKTGRNRRKRKVGGAESY